ncbi:hypothetical protein L198_03710 [Cryptococcus wingfieldii CBS 7118]|uniref:Uncharacterized protein n=1 Tax=Cryptococcus wingfieldii CBS 7118 TaxID=1295528 RepID=A0A1E3JCP9_9TREE|nr:hypothetical protein L198_03710 [Cryptococcus wingfieldii CBS 7118]ODN98465.1 hypothetical protein L198_03710 [Cryptococcus wingfieldii CBS 7118]
MIDHTANDTPYKSTATGNGYTNYTDSLVSDAPIKSTRDFKIYKSDGDGYFGPDVDGGQFLHVVNCDITFNPRSDDNKPVMAVWDATPLYTGSDPEGIVEPDCAESDGDV